MSGCGMASDLGSVASEQESSDRESQPGEVVKKQPN